METGICRYPGSDPNQATLTPCHWNLRPRPAEGDEQPQSGKTAAIGVALGESAAAYGVSSKMTPLPVVPPRTVPP